MLTDDRKTYIENAIQAVTKAENALQELIDAAPDTPTRIKLTDLYGILDLHMSQLVSARNAADDAGFTSAATALKSQAGE